MTVVQTNLLEGVAMTAIGVYPDSQFFHLLGRGTVTWGWRLEGNQKSPLNDKFCGIPNIPCLGVIVNLVTLLLKSPWTGLERWPLRALAVITEDSGSIPSIWVVAHSYLQLLFQGIPLLSSGICGHTKWYIDIHVDTTFTGKKYPWINHIIHIGLYKKD